VTVTIDLQGLISAAASGDDSVVFDALLPERAEPEKRRSTVATRKEAIRRAIEDWDLDRLLELQAKMQQIIDVITKNEVSAEGGKLTPEQAADLMAEYLDERDVAELLETRREMIKEVVFAHLDETGERELPVPEHGKKFCRDGGGSAPPSIDEQRLQAKLGDRWLEACEEVVIPPQPQRIEYRLSLEKLLEMAREDPSVLEDLRSCLVPGAPRKARFVVRDL